ncbi:MAG: PAS domain S-box-containing protein [Saprospiraceae bacterium]|jgi:PAS domain S-box-containing protein
MISPPGYHSITQRSAEQNLPKRSNQTSGQRIQIYQATRNSDGIPVLLYQLQTTSLTSEAAIQFRRAFELSQTLTTDAVLATLDWLEYRQTPIMVMAYSSALPLIQHLGQRRATIREAITLARGITQAIDTLHAQHVLHQNINPNSILVNATTKEIRLTHLHLARRISTQHHTISRHNGPQGDLHYISPEQTGRLEQPVDYRTDFYALGVTLYELLTGQLPFATKDSLELVYHHIATRPTPPKQRNPQVPKALERIVMKLLEKSPADRYQSAFAIQQDLETCSRLLEQGRADEAQTDFEIALDDISEQLTLPDILLQRSSQITALEKQLQQCAVEGPCIIFCIGEEGSGKTALLRELRKKNTALGGLSGSCMLTEENQQIPYAGIRNMFADIARQLLARPDLDETTTDLRSALASNLPSLMNFVPEFNFLSIDRSARARHVVNAFTASPAGTTKPDKQPRFIDESLKKALSTLMEQLAQPGRPLLLTTDNLHWADESSIALMIEVLRAAPVKHLMLVGTHNSQPLRHKPLTPSKASALLDRLLTPPAKADQILLENLSTDAINQLLATTLYRVTAETQTIAALIQARTLGNPKAVRQAIYQLYDEGAIYFSRQHREWSWHTQQIALLPATSAAAHHLLGQWSLLAPGTQVLLEFTACMSGSLKQDTFVGLCRALPAPINGLGDADIEAALTTGFLVNSVATPTQTPDGVSHKVYVFTHPLLAEEIYRRMDADKQHQWQYEISHHLLQDINDPGDDTLFDILEPLNSSFELLEGHPTDRKKLAQLNLAAGHRAKNAASFRRGYKYVKTAIALFDDHQWTNYALNLDMHVLAAECAYLCGDQEQLNQIVRTVRERCRNPIDEARLLEIKLRYLVTANDVTAATQLGHSILHLLNTPVAIKPNVVNITGMIAAVIFEAISARINKTSKRVMQDPRHRAVMRTLMLLSQSGYLAGEKRVGLYILKMIQLSLKQGVAPESALAYPMFGALLITFLGTIETGYRYGVLTIDENITASDPDFTTTTTQHTLLTNDFIIPWRHHLRETLEPLTQAYNTGLQQGDIEFAMFAAVTASTNAFLLGQELNSLDANLRLYSEQAHQFNQTPVLGLTCIYRQAVSNLMKPGTNPWLLQGDIYNEQALNADVDNAQRVEVATDTVHSKQPDNANIANLFILKTYLAVLFQRPADALVFATPARANLYAVASSPAIPFFVLYESLACINVLNTVSARQRLALRIRIRVNQRQLRKWSHHAPQNHLHGYHMVAAELARIDEQQQQASEHYEQAINLAEIHGYQKEYGLANELAGRFHDGQNRAGLALFYIERARSCYTRWGAMNKVEALEKEFTQLASSPRAIHNSPSRLPADAYTNYGNFLDLGAVIKATQVLSGEIILNNLLERLMVVALENAGAHSASLLLLKGQKLVLEISSQYADGVASHNQQQRDYRHGNVLPVSVIDYVSRTEQDLVLNDALNEDIFTQDSYILRQKPMSILCIPVLSRSNLTGVLYLENRETMHSFSQERIAILKLLASQSAIAIENARLYQQLNDSRNKYLTLYQNAVEGIFELSHDGTIISINPAAAQLLGYQTADEVLRLPRFNPNNLFVDEEDFFHLTNILRRNQRVVGYEAKMHRKDGSELWAALSVQSFYDSAKRFDRIEGSMIDITERKMREEAEQGQRLAQAETATKSEFLANMSHEIRTPMNAIIGYTDLALKTPLDKQQTYYLDVIRRSSNHLLMVVNDILDISRVEAGKMTIDQQPFSLPEIITDLRGLFSLNAEEKGIDLLLPLAIDATVYQGDPVRISQILINLLSNAIKFTQHGRIRLSVELTPCDDQRVRLNFQINDTGTGIAPAQQALIFDSFNSGNAQDNRAGTGLGLTICKRLVEMMGGEIHVNSVLGEGSQFTFYIFVQTQQTALALTAAPLSAAPPERKAVGTQLQGQKVLLVEDNLINQDLAREVLSSHGIDVTVAADGLQALEILEDENFFAVLMDLRMPRMDGHEAIRKIRQHPRLRSLTVVALSAGVLDHEVEKAMDSGFDYYLSKPIDFGSLIKLLAKLGRISPVLSPMAAPERSNQSTQIKTVPDTVDVDFDEALRLHDDNQKLLRHLLSEFSRLYGDADQQLQQLVDAQDGDAAARLAHNIAGVSGSFGATRLMALARHLEHQLAEPNSTFVHINLDPFRQALAYFLGASARYQSDQTPGPSTAPDA